MKQLKGIYLGACRAYHPNFNIDYNDIEKTSKHINIIDDMMNIDINKYDYIIATPPCNYYSRCNYRRETSIYAQTTKHLLPNILKKLGNQQKPFIIENVRNFKLMKKEKIFEICNQYGIFYYEYNRHSYFTNLMLNFNNIPQRQDFLNGGIRINYNDEFSKYNQGGYNVHNVIEYFLQFVHEEI